MPCCERGFATTPGRRRPGGALNLTAAESRRRFGAAPVARLATVAPGSARPHIIPVTFALDGDRIFSAVDAKPKTTRELQRLRNIRANPGVAVLADHYEADWTLLWWVRADGHASIMDGPGEMAAPIRLLVRRYPQYRDQPPAGPVICVAVQRWTGWAAGDAPAGGPPVT